MKRNILLFLCTSITCSARVPGIGGSFIEQNNGIDEIGGGLGYNKVLIKDIKPINISNFYADLLRESR